MLRKDYLARLTRAACWSLPRAEADEVVSDYRELLAAHPRTEAELSRDLGDPAQAVRLLRQGRAYEGWMAVFLVLAVSLLLPVLCVFQPVWNVMEPHCRQLLEFLPIVGMGVALVWFFWTDRARTRRPLPKGLLPLLILLLAAAAGVVTFTWAGMFVCLNGGALLLIPAARIGPAISMLFELLGVLAGVLGAIGLIRARMCNRRWRALYVLALAAVAVSVSVLTVMRHMSLDIPAPGWWIPYFWKNMGLSAVGLVMTGVALC